MMSWPSVHLYSIEVFIQNTHLLLLFFVVVVCCFIVVNADVGWGQCVDWL
jgi:hypothetical protein